MGRPRPDGILLRELPGIVALIGWFVVLPPLLGKTVFKRMVETMGPVRFNVMVHLFLWFCLVPTKMALRWTVNLKYIGSRSSSSTCEAPGPRLTWPIEATRTTSRRR